MKKRIIATILMILMYMTFTSCTYSNAQMNNDQRVYSENTDQDTVKNRVLTTNDTINVISSALDTQDHKVKAVFKREIKPMEIDSTKKFKRDSIYKKLEETEQKINMQYRQADSIVTLRKK